MPKATSRSRKSDNKPRRSPRIIRTGAIRGMSQHPGDDQSHSKPGNESQCRLRLRNDVSRNNPGKPGTDCLHQKFRAGKPGMTKKTEPSAGTSGRRAAAAWWFKARTKISGESARPSYACGVCIRSYSSEVELKRHERGAHKKELSYSKAWPEGTDLIPKHFCTLCRKAFDKGQQLYNHRRRDHSKH